MWNSVANLRNFDFELEFLVGRKTQVLAIGLQARGKIVVLLIESWLELSRVVGVDGKCDPSYTNLAR